MLCPMPWHRGMLYSIRTASHFLRVNARGLQYSTVDHLLTPSPSAWNAMPCRLDVAHANHSCAFCREPTSGMLVFPTETVSVPDNIASEDTYQNNYLQFFQHQSPCNSTHTGRHQVMSDLTYDLSLCDIFDNNLDIIFTDQPEQTLYWRLDKTSPVLLIMFGILAIYMVSCIAQNIVSSIQIKNCEVPFAQRFLSLIHI